MTAGLVLVLWVVYQMWWTNIAAGRHARAEARTIEEGWEESATAPDPRNPGTFAPGKGFALLYIPKLGLEKIPIAEGTDKQKVLNKGMVGHYDKPDTAMPWDPVGNFALAGHRNTHGEPFRYINKLDPGDSVVVETEAMYYVYRVDKQLPQTTPQHIEVIDPIPDKGPYKDPGRYLTLTTCTPDGSSTYRLIVWGELVEERPRKDGKPDALLAGKG